MQVIIVYVMLMFLVSLVFFLFFIVMNFMLSCGILLRYLKNQENLVIMNMIVVFLVSFLSIVEYFGLEVLSVLVIE